MKDLMNRIHPLKVITPVVVTDNTAQVGTIIDRQGYSSLTYLIVTGTLADADATFTVLLEEGDQANLSDAAPVDDAFLLGTEALASFNFADDAETRKLGYVGGKRYTRLTITPSGNTGNAPIAAIAVLGSAALVPTPNPPV
ncbi:hypothetical protein SNE35_28680 [Paucibacter sp. R3-3]|uniref:Head decoration protein n=1 Tax=Roseateles agri TaxID=3098619 RepID=A0ABU5DQA7_9BURK|nr:hypothetical protein [Paucibacter sp. R3-3]MDY0748510.1 hypothetical protein [Paucibacter sp. R3-3]